MGESGNCHEVAVRHGRGFGVLIGKSADADATAVAGEDDFDGLPEGLCDSQRVVDVGGVGAAFDFLKGAGGDVGFLAELVLRPTELFALLFHSVLCHGGILASHG